MAEKTRAEILEEEVRKAVGAGKPMAVETVDFSDPERPLTCLEVDFPIIPVNQVAAIEGISKPAYLVSKWWARRRSTVFRAMLLAASMKAPVNRLEAGRAVWSAFYGNHQRRRALGHLKVLDPFMGGGTTVVEGSRLGMQMLGLDLNPVAWFVVKTELAQVDKPDVEGVLADVEAEVKPQIMPFYACDCPRGHRGRWTKLSTGQEMDSDFDPLTLTPEERNDHRYDGPVIIYVFYAKHGTCQVRGCGHRTPVMGSPVVAVKTLSIRWWPFRCMNEECRREFDIEEQDARIAPGVPIVVSETERSFASARKTSRTRFEATCPHCGHEHKDVYLPERPPNKKNVELSLVVHPRWLAGESGVGPDGLSLGGSVSDAVEATTAWNRIRATKLALVEVRGRLRDVIPDPLTGGAIFTGAKGGTLSRQGRFSCQACGKEQAFVEAVGATGKTAPVSVLGYQGYCPICDSEGAFYSGRFFSADPLLRRTEVSLREWSNRSISDLSDFFPRSEIPFGHMTHQRQPLPLHGYRYWWEFFHPVQLLCHALFARALRRATHSRNLDACDIVIAAWQQYLQAQSAFCAWNEQTDRLAVVFSSNDFHPKYLSIEGGYPWAKYGHSRWASCGRKALEAGEWQRETWDLSCWEALSRQHPRLSGFRVSTKSIKVVTGELVQPSPSVSCGSATDLEGVGDQSVDLVITDPPFGGLLHYSELSDYFYVWLRLVLRDRYPEWFTAEYVPKTLEIVENKARNPDDPAGFYQRLLTAAWREAARVLKPGGILAFTFHHSEDEPWVQVLESLFDAGFYLEATYPIRSDETKGEGEFGSKKVEYDIIHVCRKRNFEPVRVSWARMRREIVREVRRLQSLLQHHQQDGLPEADIQIIKRGKALEYYSRHYGAVFEADDRALSVKDAILGVLQVLDEDSGSGVEPPPVTASPYTRQLLRMFGQATTLPRNEVQHWLRGTGIAPSEFEERGWVREEKKVYYLTPFLEVAQGWQRKHRQGMVHDYDQAAFLVGACFENSGIRAEDTLNNPNFRPHPALGVLLEWFSTRSRDPQVRTAAGRAERLYRNWVARHQEHVEQLEFRFGDKGGDA